MSTAALENFRGPGCGHLAYGFRALDMLKKSDSLCQVLPPIGNQACRSKDYMNEIDSRALCTLFCCCNKTGGRQACVKNVLWAADGANGYSGHYKAEVPYIDRQPQMSRNNPKRATRGRPAGSRIPDVVVVKDGAKPPTLDNVQKAYEMKFPGDSYGNEIGSDHMTQQEAYKDLFEDKIDEKPMTTQSCKCDDEDEAKENASVLQKARAWEAQRDQALAIEHPLNEEMWPLIASALTGGVTSVIGRGASLLLGRALQVLKLAF
ncbi:hypothetical protein [Curvibacter gracilis]|uniref:hypothetical protein n=1 Tax=Curvibacter gracilis TaxID=230310 RepID=UPI000686E4FC|nr:hypothetical protein [Curvibacter gracilis]